jgi:hypothetical protein
VITAAKTTQNINSHYITIWISILEKQGFIPHKIYNKSFAGICLLSLLEFNIICDNYVTHLHKANRVIQYLQSAYSLKPAPQLFLEFSFVSESGIDLAGPPGLRIRIHSDVKIQEL